MYNVILWKILSWKLFYLTANVVKLMFIALFQYRVLP